jgi:hypothetical protein
LRQEVGLIYGTASKKSEALSNSESSQLEAEMKLFRNILSEAKIRTESWGGRLYFVYLPSWGRYANDFGIGDKARMQVLDLIRALEIPLIDICPVFQAHRDPLSLFPFRRPGHYNEHGHQLVAETVLNAIKRDLADLFRTKTSSTVAEEVLRSISGQVPPDLSMLNASTHAPNHR